MKISSMSDTTALAKSTNRVSEMLALINQIKWRVPLIRQAIPT